jgi:thiamine-monophosphate kinase
MPQRGASRLGRSRWVTEFGLIRRFRQITGHPPHRRSSVIAGIGDDAAVLKIQPDRVLLATTDVLAEEVHFDLGYMTYRQVGYRAGVANLSDIAAMGGTPRYALIAMALSPGTTAANAEALYSGVQAACRSTGTAIVGGDTSASRDRLFVCVTILGEAKPKELLRRSGASRGDRLYVTGTVGDSRAGCEILYDKSSHRRVRIPARSERHLISRHVKPTARLPEGRTLAERRVASAAIDLSDGLAGDLRHICEESGVGATLDLRRLPLSPALLDYARARRQDPTHYALRGGEDYELLFTVPAGKVSEAEALIRRGRLCATSIGSITARRHGLQTIGHDGKTRALAARSYEHHFKPSARARSV